MSLRISHPKVFGVTESSASICFGVEDDSGPVDAPATIRIAGEQRHVSEGPAGTRCARIEGLEPNTEYPLAIEVKGAEAAGASRYFPASVATLPHTPGELVGSFATLNDLHFGEPRFGGVIRPDGEAGTDEPGFGFVRETDTDVPYWRFMNDDAIAEINDLGVDLAIVKGDIADRGQAEQFGYARESFAKLEMPCHAFLGNHDYYALNEGVEVDGYALLGQPRAPRWIDLGGWRLVLLDTVLPGEHHGVFPEERLAWLDATLEETRELAMPTLLFMHHQPVPPEFATSYPNSIGIRPEHSVRIIESIGRNPQVRGVLIGHTHRNRVRRYPASGSVPFIEVNCTKDYPGGFGHYRLYDDGSFRQEVRRTGSERALTHSTRCRDFFKGGYLHFALGDLESRSFATGGPGTAA
jgi:3',5'-cyclic AMP phosphodiesterase CpdA